MSAGLRAAAGPGLSALLALMPSTALAGRPAPEIIRASFAPGELAGTPERPLARPARAQTCGTAEATSAEAEGVRTALRRWADEHLPRPESGTIRVAFHVITARGEGEVADAQIHAQIGALNRSFARAGYRFELASVDRTDQPAWLGMTPGSGAERHAMRSLAVDPARHLNIYTCAPGQGLLGWASLPWSAPESDPSHGVVVHHSSLAGAEVPPDVARTLIHEVGHYLGGADACSAEFSADRLDRMRDVVPVYRPSLLGTAGPPAPWQPEIQPGVGAEPEDGRVLAYRGAIPNPFRGETALRFTIPTSQPVSLRVYSVTGQLVRILVEAVLPPGDHSAMFRAHDLPSGAYFAVLGVGQVRMSRTLMLVR